MIFARALALAADYLDQLFAKTITYIYLQAAQLRHALFGLYLGRVPVGLYQPRRAISDDNASFPSHPFLKPGAKTP